MLPSLTEIQALHRKYSPSDAVFDLVFTHSLIIKEIAEGIIEAKKLILDKELVTAGALLHDIGAYKLINSEGIFDGTNYIRHGVEGYMLLKEMNYPQELCNITIHHTGVGITKEDVMFQKLPLPLDNYLAKTIEEKLIMYADKFHSKTPQFNSFESYETFVKKYGNDKVEKFRELGKLFGVPNFS
jgi:uncharacterized protein